MYEDVIAAAKNASEAAVRESQERVDLAVSRSDAANKQAEEATKAVGERWTNRVNAMRRRAADRNKSTEMNFGHEEGLHPADHTENDDLVSLTEPTTVPASATPGPDPASDSTPPYGIPQPAPDTYGRHAQQQPDADRFMPVEEQPEQRFSPPTRRGAPPRRPTRPRDDEDDDYSGQSWLEGR